MNIPAAGEWSRDCELKSILRENGLQLVYHKESDDTTWILKFEVIPAYKVTGEEFYRTGYLEKLPTDGSFFEIVGSPWIHEFEEELDLVLDKFKHYILQFYDET